MDDLCWKFTEYLVWIDHLDLFQLLLGPWISQELTFSCFFPNSFTDQESWIEDTGFSQILALIWRRKYWHLDLISGRKTFSKRFGLRFGGVSVKCLTNDLWISPSVRSSEKSVCSSAFYPNFHPDPFAPTDPSIRYWHGGGLWARRWESNFFMLKHFSQRGGIFFWIYNSKSFLLVFLYLFSAGHVWCYFKLAVFCVSLFHCSKMSFYHRQVI